MQCIKCGLNVSGNIEDYICNDCIEFSELVTYIYQDVEERVGETENIDPDTSDTLKLIADSGFIAHTNPHTVLYYKVCSLIVHKALRGQYSILEEELNREIKTTKGWTDVLKVFEELNLIEIEYEKYQRKLILTEKTKNFARQYFSEEPLSDQVVARLAHLYSGYVLLHLLQIVAQLDRREGLSSLPYSQRPRTLWVILMFLWNTA